MDISVPSRFEVELLDYLEILNNKYGSIGKVYGSLPYSIIGHGRFSNLVINYGDFGFERVKSFSDRAHEIGLNVNYLANSLCLGDLGFEKLGFEKVTKYFGEVYESGADIVTVSSPYLLRIIKKEFPELKVEVSVHAHVDSVQKFRRWEQFGADIINLPGSSNRNFELLDAISNSNSLKVELLVNESCLYDCAYALYHHTLSSHRSKQPKEGLDYCMLECVSDRIKNPEEIFRAPWIRPEDLQFYEHRFNIKKFKLQGRQMNIPWILRTVEAYSKREYRGNLLDLISPTYPNWGYRSQLADGRKKNSAYNGKPDVFIDNSLLNQFFKSIVRKGGCTTLSDCKKCHICENTSKRMLEFRDFNQFDLYRNSTKLLRDSVLSG